MKKTEDKERGCSKQELMETVDIWWRTGEPE